MDAVLTSYLLSIGLSFVTVIADFLIKKASLQEGFSGYQLMLLGALIYGLTAFGWFFVMRNTKVSTLGVLYAVSCVVFMCLISIFYFKERISSIEILGVALAITSLIVLTRFA